jgi:dCMP deaminase
MSQCAVAYVPVLHEGYRRFVERHAVGRPFYVIGRGLYADYRPLAKDVRALEPSLVAASIRAWDVCSSVEVLDAAGAARLAESRAALVLPAEDVSYQLVERFFARSPVRYDTVFLRWDKTRTVQLLDPRASASASVPVAEALADVGVAAEAAARESVDWWRQVGAAVRFASGEVRAVSNSHSPHPLSAYVVGDPRSNFYKGVELELSTATHAEARLIAEAARDGISTRAAVMYVTDFPCPPCAKLIAAAGIARLYFRTGYAVLDGSDVLKDAGIEVVQAAA